MISMYVDVCDFYMGSGAAGGCNPVPALRAEYELVAHGKDREYLPRKSTANDYFLAIFYNMTISLYSNSANPKRKIWEP